MVAMLVNTQSLIVLELALTDLHRYLRGIRFSQQYTSYLPRQLLQFSLDVVSGMQYLSDKRFVHRDLAARNILLDFSLVCKIGDFGMARNLMDDSYYKSTEIRPLPVKWMAPEALLYRQYSSASDVWSFGMVLYEIWSVGRKPYEQLTNQQVIDNLNSKMCHPPPPGCPRAIYSLMVSSWHPEPRQRSTFQQLYQSLSQPEELLLSWSGGGGGVRAGQTTGS
ncbi:Ephrin type-A receptor 8 (Fragment) [Geodia barretti]|uniref:Ephrin type-A receptor 8 n=1 Tax=Geodia barretti TaxID=519541 RepID=A0AA35X4U5_GEOBA